MSVKIPTNPEHLKNFMINYIGKILPASEAKKIRKKLEKNCMDISKEMFDKIMAQYKKVVKKEKVKLDGGSKKRTKKRRKSNKRRTKKNQKGGLIGEFIIYSFGFVSLLSIALIVVAAPFILIKDCYDQHQTSLAHRRWDREDEEFQREVMDPYRERIRPSPPPQDTRTMTQRRLGRSRGHITPIKQARKHLGLKGRDATDAYIEEGLTVEGADAARDRGLLYR
jgi:hypothetical protein